MTIKEIQARSFIDKRGPKTDGEIGVLVSQDQYFKITALTDTLKKIRVARRISLTQLSKKSGLTRSVISKLENGRSFNPTLITLFKYCYGLNIDLSIVLRS
jgi:DNA-binding Xre family transcriptional regulator